MNSTKHKSLRIETETHYAAPVQFLEETEEYIQITDPKKSPNLWSVYERLDDGTVECIADFLGDNKKENAIKFLNTITPQPIYFLFGETPTSWYCEGTRENPLGPLFRYIEEKDGNIDGTLYTFEEGDNIEQLLFDYDGWMGYVKLSHKEAYAIQEKIKACKEIAV